MEYRYNPFGILTLLTCFLLIMGAFVACEGPTGPQGPEGPVGMDGSMIHAGEGVPTENIGSPGDYYLDKQAAQLYGPKTEEGWGAPLVLSGEDGEEGSRIYSGTTAPDDTLGKIGDYYLNKNTYDLYGPKSEEGWGTPINLQGPQGNDASVQAGTGLLVSGDTFSLDTSFTDARYIMPGDNGGFFVPGEFNQGTIPAEGSGTRLMWYPGKAAFRAGRVSGTLWDDANIGDYSVGLGANNEASGNFSVAMGSGDATANYSVAMGNNSTASGTYSMAMGFATDATGETSTSFGRNTVAQAEGSLVLGKYNTIAGDSDDWIPTDPLLVAGNGSAPLNRSNALTLLKNGNMTIAGTLTQNSDRRLKKDIKPLESNILEKIKKIQAVRYRFKEGTGHPSDEQLGLIAQEVQAQFPALVTKGSDGYLSLSYSKLTTVLLKGLQEQQEQIEQLDTRLKKLESTTSMGNRTTISRISGYMPLLLFLSILGVGGVIIRIWPREE